MSFPMVLLILAGCCLMLSAFCFVISDFPHAFLNLGTCGGFCWLASRVHKLDNDGGGK